MTARTVEPLYDQALEVLLDATVPCVIPECEHPAEFIIGLIGLCACRPPSCNPHLQETARFLAVVAHGVPVECNLCHAQTSDAASLILTSRPI